MKSTAWKTTSVTFGIGLSLLSASPLAAQRPANAAADALVAPVRFRSIGPAGPGGRIDDIEVAPSDPSTIYLAFATGGLFKSDNNGTTFQPVFERYETASFGDIAIHPTNPNIVYAGTGEANNRNSSSFGDGVYKTVDGGKTWVNIGLRETQTISRIVIDPHNPETVYVAANGHLFGPNPERGIYKTVNGGKAWTLVKSIDENTGFTDIVIDPSNSNVLLAASYQRRRSGCCYNGGGPGSGLWKTTDAGRSWTRLTGNGLPGGTYGRIALGIARSNPRIVYAQIEVGGEAAGGPEAAGNDEGAPGGRGFNWCNNAYVQSSRMPNGDPVATPSLDPRKSGLYRSDDGGRKWTLVSNCDERPLYFSQVSVDPQNPNTVYVAGSSAAKSIDGGHTFALLGRAGGNGEPSHVDIHSIWVDPAKSRHLMLATDGGLNVTWDQGKTWNSVVTMAVGQSYSVSADMRRPYRVYTGMQDNGVWGGPSATRSAEGVLTNAAWYGVYQNDGFQTAVDPSDYNIVYGEAQNGNVNRFDLRTGIAKSIRPVAGGQPTRPTAGTCVDGRIAGGGRGGAGGGRGGNGALGNVLNGEAGEQYRFNWNAALALSPNNPSTIWVGGNRLFKSINRGDTYVASADLTKHIDRCSVTLMGARGTEPQVGKNDGVTSYSTIITISESPIAPGTVWVGTDDGNLQVSRDGGLTFSEVGKNITGLPRGALGGENPYWISRVETSHFDPATAYVAIDGHRSDDLRPYVFVTHDFGKTFASVAGNLPSFGDVQVIREDPKNKNLLLVGTEFGLFFSIDAGATWSKMQGGFPSVRTDDILVHPRDGDLIVGTHGRGVWIADDITPLQQLTPAILAEDVHLFDVRPGVSYLRDLESDRCRPTLPCMAQSLFVAENAPRGVAINYYLKQAAQGSVAVTVRDITGRTICSIDGPGAAGVNRVRWTGNVAAPTGAAGRRGGSATSPVCNDPAEGVEAPPGDYVVTLHANGRDYTKVVQILEDRWLEQR